jgi:hypothetical protein
MLRRLSVAAQILVIVVVLVIAAAVWIAIHAVDAGGRLDAVRDDIAEVRADLIAGRDPTDDLRQAQTDARAAKQDTHDPVWFVAAWLPPIHTIRGLASAADDLADTALPSVVSVGRSVEPARLRIGPNRIALPPLRAAAPALTSAATSLARTRDNVANLSGGWGLLGDVRDRVLAELGSLAGSVDDAARFARAGPTMLGGSGLRRYFVGIQNSAESRATGGLVAAYAIVTADHGRIRVVQRGNDSHLRSFLRPRLRPVVSLGHAYDALYGNYQPAQRWTTSNLSPNFPDAANIWAHLWQAQSGQHIDGVFGVDPTALAAMLAVAGPVSVKGYPGVFNGDNLGPFIESKQYVAFAGTSQAAQTARKDFVSKVAATVLRKLLSGSGNAAAITSALGDAAGGGHLALWSANTTEQTQVSGTPLAGELPASHSPFASVSVDSATGSKLDYYLDRGLTYTAGSCSGDNRDSTISVTLTNNAPLHGLPPYVRVRGASDQGRHLKIERVPRNRLLVFIHATGGSALLGATLDGTPLAMSQGVEGAHAVFGTKLTLDPGVPRTLRLRLREPTTAGVAGTKVQALARAQQTRLNVPTCS